MSLSLKLSFLLSAVVLIKQLDFPRLRKSLSSPILCTLQREFLTHRCILTKYTLLLSLMSLESSLWRVTTTTSNSGIVPVNSTGCSMHESIKTPKALFHLQTFLINCLGIFVRNVTLILFLLSEKYSFRHQILKKEIS